MCNIPVPKNISSFFSGEEDSRFKTEYTILFNGSFEKKTFPSRNSLEKTEKKKKKGDSMKICEKLASSLFSSKICTRRNKETRGSSSSNLEEGFLYKKLAVGIKAHIFG